MKLGKQEFMKSLLLSLLFLGTGTAFAESSDAASTINSGDTAFVLMSAALVMLMTPGLALFYGGMVRTKNVLNTIMQSFFIICLISVQWVSFGYSLAFGPDISGLIGDFSWAGFQGVGMDANPDYSETIPHLAFAMFQIMFAVITPALITGAFAERMKFSAFVIFSLLWSTLIYDPVAHWIWGVGGWLRTAGVLDFAGGTAIHIISGISGLVVCIYLGKRRGYGSEALVPHNLPMTVLGACLLWFGWFGFNAGSALGANGLAANAFMTTHIASASAALGWIIVETLTQGKPTVLGGVSGAVAGLVSITPGAGFVGPMAAIIIGLLGGMICFYSVVVLKKKLGYDDSLDAFGIHGVGGLWGAVGTGLFSSLAVNPAGADGLFFGNPAQVGVQLFGAAACAAFAVIVTYAILKAMSLFMELRVSAENEIEGLDITEHGERGYAYIESSGAALIHTAALHPSLEVSLKEQQA